MNQLRPIVKIKVFPERLYELRWLDMEYEYQIQLYIQLIMDK